MTIQIAIDGPAGSGKSTISKIIAKKLDIIYLDTGAMYRGITYKALAQHIEPDDTLSLKTMLDDTDITFKGELLILDHVDRSEEIRTPKIAENVSSYAANKLVREELVKRQQHISQNNSIIMDGRDIGTVVLPNATHKIFLTASVDERAERRYKELIAKGHAVEMDSIREDIKKRDYDDMNRQTSPLKKAEDAHEVDTTGLTIEEVVSEIIKIVQEGE
ncbi:MAG: (d)CMP kinase [Clostridia bacterium]|nr:(d)CMP kinase [Clostridia bacterium]